MIVEINKKSKKKLEKNKSKKLTKKRTKKETVHRVRVRGNSDSKKGNKKLKYKNLFQVFKRLFCAY